MHTLAQLVSGQLKGTKRLKLSCHLTEFPEEILELADTLEILDLTGNKLSQLPDDFQRLQHLKIAFFSDNNFTTFPAVLASCPKLEMIGFKSNQIAFIPEDAIPTHTRWLILTNNQIEALPASIGKCHRLQKCMLAGNRLTQLPEEMAQCRNIELLRIPANELQALPEWLLSLPRLSWLAYAGNPFSKPTAAVADLAAFNWHDLVLDELLGEGASGVISKAHWQQAEQPIPAAQVAVKVFKGEVTSDGLPADEMYACMAAGAHPNLVQVLGKLTHHPAQKQGLVLGLIPPDFKNLGGPPDFNTCTRDTYPTGTSFSLEAVLQIATGIASAAKHLHSKGIMHGDLYAHNILVNDAAHPLFGDFGAATTFPVSDRPLAAALEQLEVRAYGYLLDDLLRHLAPADATAAPVHMLTRLKENCLQEQVGQRTGFGAIQEQLEQARFTLESKEEII